MVRNSLLILMLLSLLSTPVLSQEDGDQKQIKLWASQFAVGWIGEPGAEGSTEITVELAFINRLSEEAQVTWVPMTGENKIWKTNITNTRDGVSPGLGFSFILAPRSTGTILHSYCLPEDEQGCTGPELTTGSVRFTTKATWDGDLQRYVPDVGVQVVYQYRDHTGQVLASVGIPATEAGTNFLTHARVTDDEINMGIAFANPSEGGTSGSTANVTLNLYGEHPYSELIATTQLQIEYGEQLSRFLSELFPELTANRWGDKIGSGSLEIISDIPIAIAALRTETSPDFFALGSVPVFPGRKQE